MRRGLGVAAFAGVLAAALAGCTGSSPPIEVDAGAHVEVAITPTAALLNPGQTQSFFAVVSGADDPAVTWSVQESAGTVGSAGVYTAPSSTGTFHVVATSVADPSKSATAEVTVTTVPQVSVSLTPGSVSLNPGQTQQFVATVTGTSNPAVTYKIVEGASGGTLTDSGLYTAPATTGTYHVVATSVADPTKVGVATVTVTDVPQVTISLSPTAATVKPLQTQAFTATVQGTSNTSVTWSVLEGSTGGSVSSAGVYTAPGAAGIFHVVATSAADASKTAVATVTVPIPPAPSVTGVSPASPANQNTPSVLGSAEAGATVEIFGTSNCTGTVLGAGTASEAGAFSVVATVGEDTTTTFYARAIDVGGNTSPCSETFAAYVEDSQAPAVPDISTDPGSPSTSTAVTIHGSTDPDAVVRIYTTAGCSGSPVATTTANGNGAFSVGVTAAANATTTFRAVGLDAAGNASACSAGVAYTHDTVPPSPPVVTAVAPSSPANQNSPIVSGQAEPNATVRVFDNPACSGPPRGTGAATTSGTFAVSAAVADDSTTDLYAIAIDAVGNTSACSSSFVTFVEDSAKPAAPLVTSTTPSSPSNASNNPIVKGSAEPNTSIEIFTTAGCSGTPAAIGAADGAGAFAINVPVSKNQITTLFAIATDAAQNRSDCGGGLTYIHDDLAPGRPVVSGVTPSSPANDNLATVSGTAEPGSQVRLYGDSSCGGAALGTGFATSAGDFSITVTVSDDTTTDFYATATDAANNPSDCSTTSVSYIEDSTEPSAPTIASSSPASPSNASKTPTLSGTAEPGATVRIFTSSSCGGAHLASTTADGSGSFSVQVTAAGNAETSFYASATDAAKNTSACSAAFAYTHDDLEPARPTVSGVTPIPPADDNNPSVSGTAEAGATVELFDNPGCTGSALGTGTADSSGAFSVTASVGDDTQTNLYAQAIDAANNRSECSLTSVFYEEDSAAPAAPTLSGTTPASPSSTLKPKLEGAAEAGATVKVYKDSLCQGAQVGEGTADGSGQFSIDVDADPNTTTTFYATATDAADNVSGCSAGLDYRHDAIAPSPPVLSGTNPASGANHNQPTVSGTAEADATVRIFDNSSCSGTPLATGAADAFGAFSVQISVSNNSTTELFADATDAANQTSSCSSPALTYQEISPEIFGTITYGGSETGRIYVTVSSQNDGWSPIAGTSLAAPGAYEVRGLQSQGNYTVRAWMDVLDVGRPLKKLEPFVEVQVTITGRTQVDLTLMDPAPMLTPVPAPTIGPIFGGDASIAVIVEPIEDSSGEELVERYDVYCDTSGPSPVLPGTAPVHRTLPAASGGVVFITPLSNGDSYDCVATASRGGDTSALSSPELTVMVGPKSGGSTIDGSVDFAGTTPTGPLFVIAYDETAGGFITAFPASGLTSPKAYSLTGLPDGSYRLITFLDQDADGVIDASDRAFIGERFAHVSGGNVTAPTLSIPSGDATAKVRARTYKNGNGSESYGLSYEIAANGKRPIRAVILSGDFVSPPIDLGLQRDDFGPPVLGTEWELSSAPAVGSSVTIEVTFEDGSTVTLSPAVTAVLSLPTATSPVGTGTTTPTFTWDPPLSPPAEYIYTFTLWQPGGGGDLWYREGLPSTQTSLVYPATPPPAPLTAGTDYRWRIRVIDPAGNSATHEVGFKAQ